MELAIYDSINSYDGVSARSVREQLAGVPKSEPIVVRINSPGGDVFEGLAIFAMLDERGDRVSVQVDGIAASMASVIAMAGRDVAMAENAFLMIHNPVNFSFGDAADLRHDAEWLDKITNRLAAIYAKRTKKTVDDVLAIMRDETWYTAAEAVDGGFADRVTDQLALAAKFDPACFRHVPAALSDRNPPTPITEPLEAPKMPDTNSTNTTTPATFDELKAALPAAAPEFLCAMLDKKATLATATRDFMTAQAEEVAAAKKEADEAKAALATAEAAKAAKPDGQKAGLDTLPEGKADGDSDSDEDPVEAFNAAVAKLTDGGMDRLKAVQTVANKDPDLHRAYLLAINPGAKAQRQLREKFA